MTAVSIQLESQLGAGATKQQRFRWKEQGFVFELRSADSRVMEKARRIFPSVVSDSETIPALSWTVGCGSTQTDDDLSQSLLTIECDVLQFILEHASEQLCVHAALLTRSGKGVVIVGPSFAGKSTLATGLWQSGWTLMADDLCLLDTRTLSATPAPRRVSLRTESRPIVGEKLWNDVQRTPSFMHTAKGLYFHPHEVSGTERVGSTPLNAIVFLARRGASAGPAEMQGLNEAKAALSLLPYAANVRVLPLMEGLRRVSPICENVRAFDIGRGDLAAMVAAVERRVG